MTKEKEDSVLFFRSPSFAAHDEVPAAEDCAKERTADGHLRPLDHVELFESTESSGLKKQQIINKLNYMNFSDHNIFIHLQHSTYGDHFLLPVHPEPCQGDSVTCRLPVSTYILTRRYAFLHLVIPSNESLLISPIRFESAGADTVTLKLTEDIRIVNKRKALRYACLSLDVEVSQNAFIGNGTLVDFNPYGLKIRLDSGAASRINWFNFEAPATIRIRDGESTIHALPCLPIRRFIEGAGMEIILAPSLESIYQFRKRKIRNPRRQLSPPFEAIFTHPLIGKPVQRDVYDIATSGFSLLETLEGGTLLPGMIISNLMLEYAGVIRLRCNAAQVLYRKTIDAGKVKCGLAILDMGMRDYTDLTRILSSNLDPHTSISDSVDMDELWNFFFETGFIYPEKYKNICITKSMLKKTSQQLYMENPEVVRHFTYKIQGRIHGHVSMVRAYERTWMFHHLSAKNFRNQLVGFSVLKHLNHFMNELCRFPSLHLDYLICYFRPQNRFSSFLFGEFAQSLNNSRAASLDVFAYLVYPKLLKARLAEGWALRKFSDQDIGHLNRFYQRHSGGLLLEGFNLVGWKNPEESIEKVYERLGLYRRIEFFSLLYSDLLKAVFIVDRTSFGLNLSNLLNCIKILVCDPEGLPWDVLSAGIDHLIGAYAEENIPVLIYPAEYMKKVNVPIEQKEYAMITLDARYYNEFIAYTKNRCKIGYWE